MVARTAGGLAVAALVLVGCGGTTAPEVREQAGRAVPPVASLPDFSVSVHTDRSTYRVGEPIVVTVAATNTGAAARTLRYSTGSELVRWGYIIARAGRIVTYEYWGGHHIRFTDDIGFDRYAPGQTREYRYQFPFPVVPGDPDTVRTLEPGTYQVYARMPTAVWQGTAESRFPDPTPASEPVTITVTP